MKAGKIVNVGTTDEFVKQVQGKVWTCVVPAEKITMYEMQLRIINQRSEGSNQVSIRYLSDEGKTSNSVFGITPFGRFIFMVISARRKQRKGDIIDAYLLFGNQTRA